MVAANTFGRQVVDVLTNKSGGGVVAGDVVIVDTGNDAAFTTTTSARSETSIGIVQETIANNASGRVLVAGRAALVNVPASVTRGHYVETHTVAKQAVGSATRRSGSFGQFLTGGTTPTAVIWGTTDQTASATAFPTSGYANVDTDQTSTSSSFGDLSTTGPAVTITVNTKVKVTISADMYASATTAIMNMGVAVSGASTVAAQEDKKLQSGGEYGVNNTSGQMSRVLYYSGLTPGSTTFTAKYYRGGSGTAHWRYRQILVECLD